MLEKIQKNLTDTGNNVSAMGGLTIFGNICLYILNIFNIKILDFENDISGTFLMVFVGIIYIILGNRVKNIKDKYVLTYLYILFALSVLIIIFVLFSGGKVGILFFLVMIYLVISTIKIRRIRKNEEYINNLETQEYKINKISWIIFIVASLIIFLLALIIDIDKLRNANQAQNNNQFSEIQQKQNKKEWINYRSIEGNFIIDFPKYPSINRIPEEIFKGVAYSTIQYLSDPDSNTAYIAQVSDYKIEPAKYDNKAGLEGIINGMINSTDPKSTLTNSSFTKFKGYDAVNFNFTSDPNMFGKGIAFIQDDLVNIKAFILMVFEKDGDFLNYNKFIDSFQFNE